MDLSKIPPEKLAQMPAAKNPDGSPPNFDHGPNRGPLYISLSAIFLGLATICTVLRLWVRVKLQHAGWWDDVCIAIGLLTTGVRVGLNIWFCVHNGMGKHLWDVRIVDFLPFVKNVPVLAIVAEPSIGFIKLAFLLFYFRLFSTNTPVRWGIYFGSSIVFIGYTVFMFVFIFENDAAKVIINNVVGVFNVVTDFYVLLLPLGAILKLHLKTRKKIGLLAIFLTGLFACVMSIIAAVFRFRFGKQYSGHADPSWDQLSVNLVVTLESCVAIICCCVPTFPALLGRTVSGSGGRGLASGWLITLQSIRDRLVNSRSSSKAGSDRARSHRAKSGRGVDIELGDGSSKKSLEPSQSSIRTDEGGIQVTRDFDVISTPPTR